MSTTDTLPVPGDRVIMVTDMPEDPDPDLARATSALKDAETAVLAAPEAGDITLAAHLHAKGCTSAHDGDSCQWVWQDDARRTKKTPIDWAHHSRRDWLLKARRLRERGIDTPELYEQAKALFA